MTSGITEESLVQIQRAIENLALDVDRIAAKYVDGVQRATKTAKSEFSSVKKEVIEGGDEIDRKFRQISNNQEFRIDILGKAVNKMFDRWDLRQKQVFREMDRQLTEARHGFRLAGEAMGLSGARGATQGIKSVTNSLVSQTIGSVPFGGLIGLILFGGKMEAEWAAQGQRIARAAAASSMNPSLGQGKATGDFKRYQAAFGASAGADMAAVRASMSEFGVRNTEMMETDSALSLKRSTNTVKEIGATAVRGFGNTVEDIAYALDVSFNQAPGTFGKQIGQAMQTAGRGIRSTKDDIVLLSAELRKLGVNVPQVMGQFIQMQLAMRMQRQSVDDLRRSYAAIRSGLGDGVLQGAKSQHLSQMALSGMQSAQGGITNMSDGLAAVISERIGGKSGIEAIMELRQGLAGKGGESFGQIAMALGGFAQESLGATRDDQTFGLSKVMGIDIEGARAIMAMKEAMDKGFGSEEDRLKAMEEATKQLNQAFAQKAAETSPWETAMLRATMAMAKVATSALSFLGIIATGINLLVRVASIPFGGSQQSAYKASKQAAQAMDSFLSERGIGQAASGIEDLRDIATGMAPKASRDAIAAPFNFTSQIMRATYQGVDAIEPVKNIKQEGLDFGKFFIDAVDAAAARDAARAAAAASPGAAGEAGGASQTGAASVPGARTKTTIKSKPGGGKVIQTELELEPDRASKPVVGN